MNRASARALHAAGRSFAVGAAVLLSPWAVLAQTEPRLEIVVYGHMKAAVRGRIYLILPNNDEEYLAKTNDIGIATPALSRCKPEYRVVVKPEDVSYYQSTDLQCPETSPRLEVQLYLRGGEVSARGHVPAAAVNASNVSAPIGSAGRGAPPVRTQSNAAPRSLQM